MNSTPDILTVSQLSKIIKQIIEKSPSLASVYVKGEISNVTYHSSGHIYLTLKDDGALINAAFFKYANKSLKIKLEEGMSIIARGTISVYEKRGSYQLIIKSIVPDGIGQLQLRIEQLKKKLTEEGLFDPARKRPLPLLPKKIGVVTSPTGAAYRDILKVLIRRFPNIEVLLAPAKVQGDDAPETIVRAIHELNDPKYGVDIIIAGRGGGSFEDLMPFNEEIVVRAYADSLVPIISAVGHQIDHPLSDDAADVYAPTPSAAAEIAVPVKAELIESISYIQRSLDNFLERMREQYTHRLNSVVQRRVFAEPMLMVGMKQMQLDEFISRLKFSARDKLYTSRQKLSMLPDIDVRIDSLLKDKKYRFQYTIASIEQLSPLKVMSRGFAIVRGEKGNFIKTIDEINPENEVEVCFHDGTARCTVNTVEKGPVFKRGTL